MSRLRAAAMAAGGIVCLALGAWMLSDGETVPGVGIVAFGVMALAVAPMMRESRVPDEPLRVGTVRRAGRSFHGLVISLSRRRLVLSVVGSAAFTVVGVTLLLDGALLAGIACTAVFGLFTLIGLVRIPRGPGVLVLTPDELAFLTGSSASVRWDSVVAVVREDIRGTPILQVDGDVEHHGAIGRLLAQMTRRHGLAIPLGAVGVHSDWLEELVTSCVEDPAQRERIARGEVPRHQAA